AVLDLRFILSGTTPAGATRHYFLYFDTSPSGPKPLPQYDYLRFLSGQRKALVFGVGTLNDWYGSLSPAGGSLYGGPIDGPGMRGWLEDSVSKGIIESYQWTTDRAVLEGIDTSDYSILIWDSVQNSDNTTFGYYNISQQAQAALLRFVSGGGKLIIGQHPNSREEEILYNFPDLFQLFRTVPFLALNSSLYEGYLTPNATVGGGAPVPQFELTHYITNISGVEERHYGFSGFFHFAGDMGAEVWVLNQMNRAVFIAEGISFFGMEHFGCQLEHNDTYNYGLFFQTMLNFSGMADPPLIEIGEAEFIQMPYLSTPLFLRVEDCSRQSTTKSMAMLHLPEVINISVYPGSSSIQLSAFILSPVSGNATVSFNQTAQGWNISLEDSFFQFTPFKYLNLYLNITTPQGFPDGTRNSITIVLQCVETGVFTTLTLNINAYYPLTPDLEPENQTLQIQPQYLVSEHTTHSNFTLTNIGIIAGNFTVNKGITVSYIPYIPNNQSNYHYPLYINYLNLSSFFHWHNSSFTTSSPIQPQENISLSLDFKANKTTPAGKYRIVFTACSVEHPWEQDEVEVYIIIPNIPSAGMDVYPPIAGAPNSSYVEFQVNITNTGNGPDTYNLRYSVISPALSDVQSLWNASFAKRYPSGNRTPQQMTTVSGIFSYQGNITLQPYDYDILNATYRCTFKAYIPASALSGDYAAVVIEVIGLENGTPLDSSVIYIVCTEHYSGRIEANPVNLAAAPEDMAIFSLAVSSFCNIETFLKVEVFLINGSDANSLWYSVLNEIQQDIAAGGISAIYSTGDLRATTISITAPFLPANSTATFFFSLSARRWETDEDLILDTCTVQFRVLPIYRISVSAEPTHHFLYPSENSSFVLSLKNTGNTLFSGYIDYSLLYQSVFGSENISLWLESTEFTIEYNGTVNITGYLFVSSTSRAGTATVLFSVSSELSLLPTGKSCAITIEVGRIVDIALTVPTQHTLMPGDALNTSCLLLCSSNFNHSVEIEYMLKCDGALVSGIPQKSEVSPGTNPIPFYLQGIDGPSQGWLRIDVDYSNTFENNKTRILRGNASGLTAIYITGIDPAVGRACFAPLLIALLCGLVIAGYILYRRISADKEHVDEELASSESDTTSVSSSAGDSHSHLNTGREKGVSKKAGEMAGVRTNLSPPNKKKKKISSGGKRKVKEKQAR
ncbi:MAG: hypothetical protein QW728_08195, partial [Thermoplasmata archaeon]